jgi:trimethylamine:corrinoid methyltransferase-like protein
MSVKEATTRTANEGETDYPDPNSRSLSGPHSEDVGKVDEAARHILEHVGIRIDHEDCLELLDRSGAQVDRSARTVRFASGLLDELIARAPSRFDLCSRDGRTDVRLGQGKVHFANGGRVFRILDMGTGGYRRTMLRDVSLTASIVDNMVNIDTYVIACQAHDIPPENYHLNDFFHALSHTTKHVMGGCGDLKGAKQLRDLAAVVAGGEEAFRDRPFVSVITNPVSPLTIDPVTVDILRFCCTHGMPVTCAPAPISGATSPATMAGTLAQMHAEAMAGVALAQAMSPGAKILYGAVATTMDLRTMDLTMGSVEAAILNGFAVRLAKLYDLPIYASAGVTEAKRPDVQSGVEKSFSILSTAQAGADFIHLAAGMLDSGNSISYEQYVIDDEIIGMTRRFLEGVAVNRETLGVDVIEKVGAGGNYVTEDHTVDHMMEEFFYPALAVRSNFDVWESKGRPDMLSRANARVEEILRNSTESLLAPELIDRIKETFSGIENI